MNTTLRSPTKVVVLLSGGLDSMLCLAQLVASPVHEIERVHALSFDYGQSSMRELTHAALLCRAWGVPHTTVKLHLSRTDTHKEIPARNLIFAAHACAFAVDLGFNAVALGAEPDSTYTDSSLSFQTAANGVLQMFGVELIYPVKHLRNKVELVQRALDLGLPLHHCHSSRSDEVDGGCRTSALFLDAVRQIFPNVIEPRALLSALGDLHTVRNETRNTYQIDYGDGRSFKYAAALFTLGARPEFARDYAGSGHPIHVYSTGSWMGDLGAAVYSALTECPQDRFEMHRTDQLDKLRSQPVNCDHHVAQWGIKQALGELKRPRYMKHVACRVVQGHLAAALEDLGYVVTRPNVWGVALLETTPRKEGAEREEWD